MFALLLPLLVAPASADSLTREAALREAVATSPVIGRAEAVADEQSWKKAEALSGFLPSLQATGARYFVRQFEYNDISFGGAPTHVPLIIPASRATLLASIPLFDGFANVLRYSSASRGAEAAREDFDWTRFQLEQETLLRFSEALAAVKLQLVAEQNVATLTDHLEQVTKTRRGGLATQYDVLRVEVQLNEAQSELLRAKDDVVLARQTLAQTMGVDPRTDHRELVGELDIPLAGGVRELRLEEAAGRKDLAALALRAESAAKASNAAGTYWVPRLSLGAQYTLYNNHTECLTDWTHYRAAWNAGVFVTWNLFDGASSIAKSKEAGAKRIQAEKDLEIARGKVPTDFEFWKRRYLYSTALYEAKLSDVKKGEESVRLAKAALKAGARTNSEVLDAELDLFRARAGLVNSLRSSAEARIRLELAIGHKLSGLVKNPS